MTKSTKHPQFRDGKINLIIKSDKTAFVVNGLPYQDREVGENGEKGQDSATSNTNHVDKTKLF